VAKVSPLQFFYPPDHKTVGLRTTLLNDAEQPLGRLDVLIKLDYLMEGVRAAGWLHTYMACLVNEQGQYLAHTNPAMATRHCLGETQDPLELAMLKAMKEKPYGTEVGHNQVIGYYRLNAAPWAIMLHAQENQIMAPILHFRFYYILAGLLCLAVSLVLIRLGVGSMVAAIRRISRKAALVAQGDYGEPLEVRSQDEIGQLTLSFNDMVAGLKERDFISNTFGRYVDQEIAAKLMQRPEASRLGGEKRQVVIMFSDIRDFTPLAETLTPEATIHLLNGYFSRMVEVLRRHHGIIVDFLGDGILAFFDPLDGPLTPVAGEAVQCALHMQQAMPEVNLAGIGQELPPLHMGIGLHAGEVVVGNIGSESRAKYGIIGSAVNLAHRIQSQARRGEVVVSQDFYRLVQPEVRVTRKFEVRLKGIQAPVTLYAVGQL
jgi:class 3 adenylate cyclase